MRPTVPTGAPVVELGHLRCCTVCGACYRTDYERCALDGGTVVVTKQDPLVGTTLGGHYEIEELIGVGAMGRVYRAHHTRLVNKRYALKVLFGELTASAIMRMRFAHEAESASKLDHPNIVGVLDFGCTDAGLMFLVMDLVDGPTLGALVDQGAIAPARVARFARQLCEGLAHAHARDIVHRDFKPDNILVAGEPGAELLRIADFGLAITASGDDARLTSSGVVCTPTYAAPEQLLGKEIDHRADLYALGVTIYEMLTGGVLPFERSTHDVMLWKTTSEWPAVSERAPDVPPRLARLVRRLLARNPDERPGSAREVIHLLDAIADETEVLVRPKRRIRQRALGGLVVVGACVIVAAGVARDRGEVEPIATADLAIAAAPAADPSERAHLMAAAPGSATAPLAAVHEDESVEPMTAATVITKPAMAARATAKPATAVTATTKPSAPTATAKRATPAPATGRGPQQLAVRAPTAVQSSGSPPRSDPPSRSESPPRSEPSSRLEPPSHSDPPPVPAPDVSDARIITAPPRDPQPVAAARMPSPAPTQAIVQPPPPRPRPSVPARAPRIVGLEVSGAFPSSVVRRAIERVLPALESCSDKVGTRVVKASFAIEETRRATGVRIGGVGASCVAAELASVRTEVAPDVGEVTVVVRLSFGS